MNTTSRRVKIEAALAGLCAVQFLTAVAFPDWFEVVLGVEPDGGSGMVEWLIPVALAAAGLCLSITARRDWRRLRAATQGQAS